MSLKPGSRYIYYSDVERIEFHGARYGKPWTEDEKHNLRLYYSQEMPFLTICEELGRPAAGVISKMTQLGLVTFNEEFRAYYVRTTSATVAENLKAENSDSTPTSIWLVQDSLSPKHNDPLKDNEMNKTEFVTQAAHIPQLPNIETVVRIQGQDASRMSDDDIFSFIAKLETQKKVLNGVENKPKKLTAKIDALQADIEKLVAYVDAR